MKQANLFSFRSIGGLGEVGMNCMILDFGGTVIGVDAGTLFADINDCGLEGLHPDFSAFFENCRPKSWIITHGHEDHIGAVPYLFAAAEAAGLDQFTVYAPRFAKALIEEKLSDAAKVAGAKRFLPQVKELDGQEGSIMLEGGVELRWVAGRHSTPDSLALGFCARLDGHPFRLVHTADFKIDQNRYPDGVRGPNVYRLFGEEPIDLLLMDSTNAERSGHSVSELEIIDGLKKVVTESKGRVFISLFSSNLDRLLRLLQMARDTKRIPCVVGRSLETSLRIGRNLGIDHEVLGGPAPELLPVGELSAHPREAQFVVCSGSQGEDRSVLMRLSQGMHADLRIDSGDTVILSSKTIPGNERPLSRLVNQLLRQGADVLWEDVAKRRAGGPIHASGHARRDELRLVIDAVKPRHLLPVHGELRQLTACAELGVASGIPHKRVHVVENHHRVSFAWKDAAWEVCGVESEEDPGRMLRFDRFLVRGKESFLKERKRGASGGVVSAVLDSAGRVSIEHQAVVPEGMSIPEREIEKFLSHQHAMFLRQGAFQDRTSPMVTDARDEISRIVKRAVGAKPLVLLHLVQL